MAALLDSGNGPGQLVQMHPFFRKGSMNGDVPLYDTSTVKSGLGGTSEENGPHVTSHTALCDGHVRETAPVPPHPIPQGQGSRRGPWSATDVDDLEYENMRIKRRRVSLGPEQPGSQAQLKTDRYHQTFFDQLVEAATQPVELDKDGEQSDTPVSAEPQTLMVTTDPACATETVVAAEMTEYESLTTPLCSNQLSQEHETQISTPNKPVWLDGVDEPRKIPTSSPRRSPRMKKDNKSAHGEVRKVGRRAKKIEMKNGRFVSSLRITLPYTTAESGSKIEDILSGRSNQGAPMQQVKEHRETATNKRSTHPFFLGKLNTKGLKLPQMKYETSSTGPGSEDDVNQSPEAPKPWKDIVFSRKAFQGKTLSGMVPPWPPTPFQHVQPDDGPRTSFTITSPTSPVLKSKHQAFSVKADEDVLQIFGDALKTCLDQSDLVHIPQRKIMSGKELSDSIGLALEGTWQPSDQWIAPLRRRIETTPSSFDKGMAAGPQMWPQEYAPTCWQEVLQPQTRALHDWLSNLRVHQVQTGKLQTTAKLPAAKKRRKRKSDGMDDFIVDSDGDDQEPSSSGKNAILLVGPSGCGKTASVFAVAQQLGFEVFEIHPGMKRSARDIQERVGDMTQNHLVQRADTQSRRSSLSVDDASVHTLPPEPVPASQRTMERFMGAGKRSKKKPPVEAADSKALKTRPQKQSLILFEEVDILFDEDRGFWNGVESLISSSKRPVILTCNDLQSIPLAELDLFTVLTYEQPESNIVVHHLQCIAAAEGHLLSQEAVRSLYLSKGQDLRASITELNLWCQMTVGSHQGGLDWMLPYKEKRDPAQDGSVTRIVSQDTFVRGLDLLPISLDNFADVINFAEDSSGIAPSDWIKDASCLQDADHSEIETLDDMLLLSESRSIVDLFDVSTASLFVSTVAEICPITGPKSPREGVVRLYLEHLAGKHTSRIDIADVFEPLMEERRIGLPMAPGRSAPSIDNAAQSVVTEVAPYVRCIVAHDQRLERLRSELSGGPQVKRQRTTRAARAALEGGDKGTVRRDRWFSERLDIDTVLRTGNAWPQLRSDEASSAAATPVSSVATEF